MANTLSDDIRNHIPSYLTPQQKDDLLEQIKNFPKISHYIHTNGSDILQGDGWSGFTVLEFNSGEKKQVKGVVLSNSCDIDTDNDRALNINIIFVPLVKIEKFKELLTSAGIPKVAVEAKIEAIMQQKVTSVIYFPKGSGLDADYMANLDDVHSQPLLTFLSADRKKLFTLSQAGFYMFVLKLSIHFCRFQEGVLRYDE